MEYREDPRHCKWLARGQMRRLVSSQDEENMPTQAVRGSWPDGGDAQEVDAQSRMRSDWAALATDGAAGYSIVNPVGPWCDQDLALCECAGTRVNGCRPHTRDDVCGQEMAQRHNTSFATPIAVQHQCVHLGSQCVMQAC